MRRVCGPVGSGKVYAQSKNNPELPIVTVDQYYGFPSLPAGAAIIVGKSHNVIYTFLEKERMDLGSILISEECWRDKSDTCLCNK